LEKNGNEPPMIKPKISNRFKKDLKKLQHNKTVLLELDNILKFLLLNRKLPEKYLDHPLIGNYKGYRECHIKPNVLLIYFLDEAYVHLVRIGSHSELF
jgi:mRNA interferase YafQ